MLSKGNPDHGQGQSLEKLSSVSFRTARFGPEVLLAIVAQ